MLSAVAVGTRPQILWFQLAAGSPVSRRQVSCGLEGEELAVLEAAAAAAAAAAVFGLGMVGVDRNVPHFPCLGSGSDFDRIFYPDSYIGYSSLTIMLVSLVGRRLFPLPVMGTLMSSRLLSCI
jgi:hypothetical protein